MKLTKLSEVLSLFAWAFVFVDAALILVQKIPSNGVAWGLFALFFFVATTASAVSRNDLKSRLGIFEISINGKIYTEKNEEVIVHPLATGRTLIFIRTPLPPARESSLPTQQK